MCAKPLVLGVETSCDESSLALLNAESGGFEAEVTLTQQFAHSKFGGVVPDLASRMHLELLPELLQGLHERVPNWTQALRFVAGTTRPGLLTSLLVGGVFAKSMAELLKLPFVPIDHCEAHVFSSLMTEQGVRVEGLDSWAEDLPAVALVISGGHSLWVEVNSTGATRCLGTTLDDAMGECYDKTAKMLGLGYPGGPEVERMARQGDASAYPLPLPLPGGVHFSFSGLKTAVRWLIERESVRGSPQKIRDVCASFQGVMQKLIHKKITTVIERLRPQSVWLSGGVSANHGIRETALAVARQKGVKIRLVPKKYAGDNASMIAYLGFLKYKQEPGFVYSDLEDGKMMPRSIFAEVLLQRPVKGINHDGSQG
jgi:N6-L-threonylcarbamoyladenine synthase